MYNKEYYEKNKKKILNSQKKYNQKNKEKNRKSAREYRKNHWNEITRKRKEFREKNPLPPHKKSWEKVRLEVLLRDSYTCQECNNRATEVHHKDGTGHSQKSRRNMNNNLENLISVCHRCNLLLALKEKGKPFSIGSPKLRIKRDKKIIELLKNFSQIKISKMFGLTRQRISQIKKKYN